MESNTIYQSYQSNLASPWLRIAATLIDNFVVVTTSLIFAVPIGVGSFFLSLNNSGNSNIFSDPNVLNSSLMLDTVSTVILSLITTSIWAVVFLMIPLYKWKGQSIGKKLLKIKIVKEDGQLVENSNILKRYAFPLGVQVLSVIPFVGLCTACIAFIVVVINTVMLFADQKRQTLFDKLAKTIVVEE